MSIILIVGLLLWVCLSPNERRPYVNKKKLVEDRIREAHKILLKEK